MATEISRADYSRDQLDLLKRTIANGTTDDEFALFIATAKRLGVDPFARQIYAVKRYSREAGGYVMAIQVGIDGFRLVASRTGEATGQEGPYWCGPDGVWRDIWLDDKPPAAAKVVVLRRGHPYVGVATMRSYCQRKKDGAPMAMWGSMPDVMIAKVAESLALRKAFPAELSDVYSPEEMAQASNDHDEPPARVVDVLDRGAKSPPSLPARDAVDALPAKAGEPDEVEQMIIAMRDCDTVEDLKRLGKPISTMPKQSADALRAPYAARLAEIKGRA